MVVSARVLAISKGTLHATAHFRRGKGFVCLLCNFRDPSVLSTTITPVMSCAL